MLRPTAVVCLTDIALAEGDDPAGHEHACDHGQHE